MVGAVSHRVTGSIASSGSSRPAHTCSGREPPAGGPAAHTGSAAIRNPAFQATRREAKFPRRVCQRTTCAPCSKA